MEDGGEAGHSLGCGEGEYGDTGGDSGGVGIYVVDGDSGAHLLQQSGGGVDVERRADHHEDVGVLHEVDRRLDIGHRFLKKYDVGAHAVTVDHGVGGSVERPGVEGVYLGLVVDGAYLHQLAMQVEHMGAAGAFMQVVDILCDHVHVVPLFQIYQSEMSGIRLGFEEIVAALVVKLMHECRIGRESICAGHLHHRIFFPKSTCVAEGGYAAFGAHSCAGRYYEFRFHHCCWGGRTLVRPYVVI